MTQNKDTNLGKEIAKFLLVTTLVGGAYGSYKLIKTKLYGDVTYTFNDWVGSFVPQKESFLLIPYTVNDNKWLELSTMDIKRNFNCTRLPRCQQPCYSVNFLGMDVNDIFTLSSRKHYNVYEFGIPHIQNKDSFSILKNLFVYAEKDGDQKSIELQTFLISFFNYPILYAEKFAQGDHPQIFGLWKDSDTYRGGGWYPFFWRNLTPAEKHLDVISLRFENISKLEQVVNDLSFQLEKVSFEEKTKAEIWARVIGKNDFFNSIFLFRVNDEHVFKDKLVASLAKSIGPLKFKVKELNTYRLAICTEEKKPYHISYEDILWGENVADK